MSDYVVSKVEYEFIQRMREFKQARRSKLLHIKTIINSPMVKPSLFEKLYKEERAALSMFSRMV